MSSWFAHTEKNLKKTQKKIPFPKRRFKCVRCDWSFDSAAKLSRHKDVHRHPGSFVCQVCFVLFGHAYNLYNHWRTACTAVSGSQPDAATKANNIAELRKLVLCAMGAENRAQQFHVFGGVIFIPSQWFLGHKYNIVDPNYQTSCHLCHLTVPNKFLECHGDVHRGRHRIDGKIYGEYFCHICGVIFREQSNLIDHWRHDCHQVIAYTPEDIYLDKEELIALAWLVLQTTIPRDQVVAMAKNSKLTLEKRVKEHAAGHGYSKIHHLYYHFPQEIWPLPFNFDLDLVTDSLPIMGPNAFVTQNPRDREVNVDHPKLPVHITNLLAQVAPDFYATGMTFHEISHPPKKIDAPKNVYRILLRYTTEGSVISTYKINARTCPVLRPTKMPNSKFQPADYDVDKPYKAIPVKKLEMNSKQTDGEKFMYTISWPCRARFQIFKEGNSFAKKNLKNCPLCNRVTGARSLREHWKDCVPVKAIIDDPVERRYVDEKLANIIKNYIGKINHKIVYEWPNRPEAVTDNMRETVDRIGEYHKLSFHLSDRNLKKLKEALKDEIEKAKERFMERENLEKNFQPNESPIICCPHCGGRFNHLQIFTHLEHRHFYPNVSKFDGDAISEWRSNKCPEPYQFLGTILEGVNNTMTWLSTELYEKCINTFDDGAYNDNTNEFVTQGYRNSALSPWTYNTTYRVMEILDPLILVDEENTGRRNRDVTIIAPEPLRKLHYTDNVLKIDDIVDMNNINEMNQADIRISDFMRFEENPVDLMTQEPLSDDCKQIYEEESKFFYSLSLNNPIITQLGNHSLGYFFQKRETADARRRTNRLMGINDESDVELAISDHGLTDEDQTDGESVRRKRKKRRKVNEQGEDDLDYAIPPNIEDIEKEEETKESMKKRQQLKQQEYRKKERLSRAGQRKEPTVFEFERFDSKNLHIHPDKHAQLGFLSEVICTRDEEMYWKPPDFSETVDPEEEDRDLERWDEEKEYRKRVPRKDGIMALSRNYENAKSDCRLSAYNFYKYYVKAKPPKSKKWSNMNKSDQEKCFELSPEDFWDVAVSPEGVIFVNGSACSGANGPIGSYHKVNIKIEDLVHEYRIFNCKDQYGKFRWVWPVNEKFDQCIARTIDGLRRLKITQSRDINEIRRDAQVLVRARDYEQLIPTGVIFAELLNPVLSELYELFCSRKSQLEAREGVEDVERQAWKDVYRFKNISKAERLQFEAAFREAALKQFEEQECLRQGVAVWGRDRPEGPPFLRFPEKRKPKLPYTKPIRRPPILPPVRMASAPQVPRRAQVHYFNHIRLPELPSDTPVTIPAWVQLPVESEAAGKMKEAIGFLADYRRIYPDDEDTPAPSSEASDWGSEGSKRLPVIREEVPNDRAEAPADREQASNYQNRSPENRYQRSDSQPSIDHSPPLENRVQSPEDSYLEPADHEQAPSDRVQLPEERRRRSSYRSPETRRQSSEDSYQPPMDYEEAPEDRAQSPEDHRQRSDDNYQMSDNRYHLRETRSRSPDDHVQSPGDHHQPSVSRHQSTVNRDEQPEDRYQRSEDTHQASENRIRSTDDRPGNNQALSRNASQHTDLNTWLLANLHPDVPENWRTEFPEERPPPDTEEWLAWCRDPIAKRKATMKWISSQNQQNAAQARTPIDFPMAETSYPVEFDEEEYLNMARIVTPDDLTSEDADAPGPSSQAPASMDQGSRDLDDELEQLLGKSSTLSSNLMEMDDAPAQNEPIESPKTHTSSVRNRAARESNSSQPRPSSSHLESSSQGRAPSVPPVPSFSRLFSQERQRTSRTGSRISTSESRQSNVRQLPTRGTTVSSLLGSPVSSRPGPSDRPSSSISMEASGSPVPSAKAPQDINQLDDQERRSPAPFEHSPAYEARETWIIPSEASSPLHAPVPLDSDIPYGELTPTRESPVRQAPATLPQESPAVSPASTSRQRHSQGQIEELRSPAPYFVEESEPRGYVQREFTHSPIDSLDELMIRVGEGDQNERIARRKSTPESISPARFGNSPPAEAREATKNPSPAPSSPLYAPASVGEQESDTEHRDLDDWHERNLDDEQWSDRFKSAEEPEEASRVPIATQSSPTGEPKESPVRELLSSDEHLEDRTAQKESSIGRESPVRQTSERSPASMEPDVEMEGADMENTELDDEIAQFFDDEQLSDGSIFAGESEKAASIPTESPTTDEPREAAVRQPSEQAPASMEPDVEMEEADMENTELDDEIAQFFDDVQSSGRSNSAGESEEGTKTPTRSPPTDKPREATVPSLQSSSPQNEAAKESNSLANQTTRRSAQSTPSSSQRERSSPGRTPSGPPVPSFSQFFSQERQRTSQPGSTISTSESRQSLARPTVSSSLRTLESLVSSRPGSSGIPSSSIPMEASGSPVPSAKAPRSYSERISRHQQPKPMRPYRPGFSTADILLEFNPRRESDEEEVQYSTHQSYPPQELFDDEQSSARSESTEQSEDANRIPTQSPLTDEPREAAVRQPSEQAPASIEQDLEMEEPDMENTELDNEIAQFFDDEQSSVRSESTEQSEKAARTPMESPPTDEPREATVRKATSSEESEKNVSRDRESPARQTPEQSSIEQDVEMEETDAPEQEQELDMENTELDDEIAQFFDDEQSSDRSKSAGESEETSRVPITTRSSPTGEPKESPVRELLSSMEKDMEEAHSEDRTAQKESSPGRESPVKLPSERAPASMEPDVEMEEPDMENTELDDEIAQFFDDEQSSDRSKSAGESDEAARIPTESSPTDEPREAAIRQSSERTICPSPLISSSTAPQTAPKLAMPPRFNPLPLRPKYYDTTMSVEKRLSIRMAKTRADAAAGITAPKDDSSSRPIAVKRPGFPIQASPSKAPRGEKPSYLPRIVDPSPDRNVFEALKQAEDINKRTNPARPETTPERSRSTRKPPVSSVVQAPEPAPEEVQDPVTPVSLIYTQKQSTSGRTRLQYLNSRSSSPVVVPIAPSPPQELRSPRVQNPMAPTPVQTPTAPAERRDSSESDDDDLVSPVRPTVPPSRFSRLRQPPASDNAPPPSERRRPRVAQNSVAPVYNISSTPPTERRDSSPRFHFFTRRPMPATAPTAPPRSGPRPSRVFQNPMNPVYSITPTAPTERRKPFRRDDAHYELSGRVSRPRLHPSRRDPLSSLLHRRGHSSGQDAHTEEKKWASLKIGNAFEVQEETHGAVGESSASEGSSPPGSPQPGPPGLLRIAPGQEHVMMPGGPTTSEFVMPSPRSRPLAGTVPRGQDLPGEPGSAQEELVIDIPTRSTRISRNFAKRRQQGTQGGSRERPGPSQTGSRNPFIGGRSRPSTSRRRPIHSEQDIDDMEMETWSPECIESMDAEAYEVEERNEARKAKRRGRGRRE
ncbi:CBN-SDC-1 protein [Caenorhabditis brenneri]|uniref:CBN-SDC-1 protein n=1 Tax=Caenorhabditis brenneri TaxID=135651 RepID=G0MM13_CAEBE|nr:CBN-SDC-1 protein [Caenorhabditis brenneri]